jgi:hypothetical protein
MSALETKTQHGSANGTNTLYKGPLIITETAGNANVQSIMLDCDDFNGPYLSTNTKGFSIGSSAFNLNCSGPTNIRCGTTSHINLEANVIVPVGKTVTSDKFVTRNGTAAQFLMGNGSLNNLFPVGPQGIPGPSVFAGLYPFNIASNNLTLSASSKTYYTTYTMTASSTITKASIYYVTAGSDNARIAIYRGDLNTATLMGQTTSTAPTSNYMTRTFVVETGQSLAFVHGDQVTVAYTTAGGTTSVAVRNTTLNTALGVTSSTTYTSSGFPATISNMPNQTSTGTRICMELS